MHLGDGGDAAHRVGQRGLDLVLSGGARLQMQQRGDDLERIADAVIDLAQQHFAFGGERRVAVARGMDLGLGFLARALQLGLAQRAFGRDMQQRDEVALDVLDQIVGRACLQRGDGDAGILRRRDEHHRRRVRDRHDLLERLEPVETRHVLVERHDIDAALEPVCALRMRSRPSSPLAA